MAVQTVQVEAERTVIIHVYLHSAARLALEHAEKSKDGQFFNVMNSLISSAFCLEAYFNFVGEEIVPHWEMVEKKLSPKEKLDLICAYIGLQDVKGTTVYPSFQRAFKFRNLVAHGRAETVKGSWIEKRESGSPREYPETEWEKLCTVRMAMTVLSDVETLIRLLHEKAGLNDDPFGSLGYGMSEQRLRQMPPND